MSSYTSISFDRLVGRIGIPGALTPIDVCIDGRFAPVPHLTWRATVGQSGVVISQDGDQSRNDGGPARNNVPAEGS